MKFKRSSECKVPLARSHKYDLKICTTLGESPSENQSENISPGALSEVSERGCILGMKNIYSYTYCCC